MAAVTELATLLRTMRPVRRDGQFVFCVVDDPACAAQLAALATVREPEGITVVLTREDADAADLAYDDVAAWITLTVHSDRADDALAALAALAEPDGRRRGEASL